MTTPSEEQRAHCRNCGSEIIWHFDRDDEARIKPPDGFWFDAETMTESCGEIEDGWHEPDSEVWEAALDHVASLAENREFVKRLERIVNDDIGVYLVDVDCRDILAALANP